MTDLKFSSTAKSLVAGKGCFLFFLLFAVSPARGIILAEHRGDVDPKEAGWVRQGSLNNVVEGPVQVGLTPAWVIDDNSTASGSTLFYQYTPSPSDIALASTHGWRFSGDIYLPENDTRGGPSVIMSYDNGSRAYQLTFGVVDGPRTARATYTGRGTADADNNPGERLNRFVLESTDGNNGDFFINGEDTNLSYGGASASLRRIIWGAGSSADNGRGEYALIRFETFSPVEDYLQGYYPLNGNANDFSGNLLGGILNAANAVPGVEGNSGGAVQFFDPTSRVIIPDASQLQFDDRFTISLWYRADPIPRNERRRLIGKWDGNYTERPRGAIMLSLVGERNDRDARYEWQIGDENGFIQTLESDGIVRTGEWNHVAIRMIMGHLAIFHNGEEVAAGFLPGATLADSTWLWGIGADGSGPNQQPESFRGSLDEVRFFNVALSDEEVSALTDERMVRLSNLQPGDGETVDPNQPSVILVFNGDVDPGSINAETVRVRGSRSGAIPYNLSMLDGHAPQLAFTRTLQHNETVEVEITGAVRGAAGVPVARRVIQFRTALSPETEAYARDSNGRIDSMAGLSVDTSTGAFLQQRAPLKVQSIRTMAVPLAYNSMLTHGKGGFGYGWSHAYEARLEWHTADRVTIHWNPNQRNTYERDPQSGDWRGLEESSRWDAVTDRESSNQFWVVRENGQEYIFNRANGDLLSIANFKSQEIDLENPDGHLMAIHYDFSDQRIEFTYDRQTGLIESLHDVDPETGEPFRHVFFEYDKAHRLVTIHEPAILDQYPAGEPFSPVTMNDGPQGLTLRTIRVEEGESIGFFTFDLGNISHQRVSDLTVSLVSPQGTTVVLHDREPGFPNLDFSGLRLDDFNGEDPKGDWQLRIIDHVAGVFGSLNGFTFHFSEATNPVRYGYTNAPVSPAGQARIREALDMLGQRLYTVAYDGEGRVVSQNDGVDTNLQSKYAYQPLGGGRLETRYTDRTGETHRYEHDSAGRLLSLEDPLGHTFTFTYDVLGNRTSLTDPLGRTTHFTYTDTGRLATVREPSPGNPVTTYEYDSRNRIATIRDALGNETQFSYDNNNNLRRITDAHNNQDNKSYGGSSQMLDSLVADGGGVGFTYRNGQLTGAAHMQESDIEADMAYDPAGRTLRLIDAEGHETRVGYYANDQIRARIDPLGNSEITLLDHRSRVREIIDKRGNSTRFEYDGNNNLVRETDPLGRVTTYEYDGEDRQIRIRYPGGRVLENFFDAAGRLLATRDSLGGGQSYRYDAAGNMTEVYDAEGRLVSRTTYNARNQAIQVEDGNGNVSTMEYDLLGRQTSMTDPQGAVTRLEYDSIDRLIKVTDPLGREFRQEYAADDVVRRILNPDGHGIRFNYDQANRMTGYETPNSSYIIRYDGRDLVTREFVSGEGGQVAFEYDELGRMIEKAFSSGNYPEIHGFSYDANGNLTEVGTRSSSGAELEPVITREFDALDRLVTYRDGRGNTLRYAYHEGGQISHLTYPDGRQVAYDYDAAGQLVQVRDWAGRSTRFHYNDNGLITFIDFPNDTFRVMAYDDNNQLVERADYTSSGEVIVRYVYSYDGDGRIRSERIDHDQAPYQPPSVNMTYDNRNRLETYNGLTVNFDRAGKMTRGPLQGGLADFTYDDRGNLIQVGNTGYRYDLEDNLTGIEVNGQLTDLVVNPAPAMSQILRRTTPQGVSTYYVWGIGLLYEESQLGGIRVYHYDARGSTMALSGDSGEVETTIEYGPFGERVRSLGVVDTPFTFNGLFGVITGPQGLSWMRFRWYHPEIRRFLTEDAHFGNILQPASLNRYAYAGNNPISQVDPQGEAFWVAIGAAVGAVVNVGVEFISDLADDGTINTPAEDYVAAAIGGAVGGAIITACPTCGIISGAAGAATQTLLAGIMKGENLTEPEFLVGLGVDVAVGAAFGKLGAGKGGLSRGSKNALRRNAKTEIVEVMVPGGRVKMMAPVRNSVSDAITPGGNIPIPVPPRLQEKLSVRAGRDLGNAAVDLVAGFFQNELTKFIKNPTGYQSVILNTNQPEPGMARPVNAGGHTEVYRRSVRNLNARHKGVYGEHAHWGDYVRFLQLADQPVIAETAGQIRSF